MKAAAAPPSAPGASSAMLLLPSCSSAAALLPPLLALGEASARLSARGVSGCSSSMASAPGTSKKAPPAAARGPPGDSPARGRASAGQQRPSPTATTVPNPWRLAGTLQRSSGRAARTPSLAGPPGCSTALLSMQPPTPPTAAFRARAGHSLHGLVGIPSRRSALCRLRRLREPPEGPAAGSDGGSPGGPGVLHPRRRLLPFCLSSPSPRTASTSPACPACPPTRRGLPCPGPEQPLHRRVQHAARLRHRPLQAAAEGGVGLARLQPQRRQLLLPQEERRGGHRGVGAVESAAGACVCVAGGWATCARGARALCASPGKCGHLKGSVAPAWPVPRSPQCRCLTSPCLEAYFGNRHLATPNKTRSLPGPACWRLVYRSPPAALSSSPWPLPQHYNHLHHTPTPPPAPPPAHLCATRTSFLPGARGPLAASG